MSDDEIEIDGTLYSASHIREKLIEKTGALQSIPVDRLAAGLRDGMFGIVKIACGENLPDEKRQYELANQCMALARDAIVQCCDAVVSRGLETTVCRVGDVKRSAKDGSLTAPIQLIDGELETFVMAAGTVVKVTYSKPVEFYGDCSEPAITPNQARFRFDPATAPEDDLPEEDPATGLFREDDPAENRPARVPEPA